MKNKYVFLCGLCCAAFGLLTLAAADQFILPQQTHKQRRLSKNELKEAVGQGIRDVFTVLTALGKQAGLCQVAAREAEEAIHYNDAQSFKVMYRTVGSLQKSLGTLHVEVAELQQTFSHLIKRLIDNQKPFKKASRDTLNAAFHVLQDVRGGLKKHAGQITGLHKHLAKITHKDGHERVTVLADLNKTTNNAIAEIKKSVDRISSCEGLKIS
jgi:hypothetical protein